MSGARLNILVVDDEPNIRKTLGFCLEAEGHQVVSVSNVRDAKGESSRKVFDLAFVDIRLGVETGLDLIPELLSQCPWIRIVMITAFASIETAVEAMKRGAWDYLPKPFTPDQVRVLTRKLAEVRSLEHQLVALQEAMGKAHPEADLVSESPVMQKVISLARQVAESHATILLSGESGTGKSVFAKAIHAWSGRASRPFSTVSCPSLSAELLESELFGHAKGAFTGAVRDTAGRIALCEGGTIFLDEIADLPLSLQPKLLRFLQDKEYEPLGDPRTRYADVRVLAATNRDLEEVMKEGCFREDLYYRLNVIRVEIPSLRERPEDILPLAAGLLIFFCKQNRKPLLTFSEEAVQALQNHTWPGNVRELRNAVEHAVILCRGDRIEVGHLPGTMAAMPLSPSLGDPLPLERIKEEHIRRVLASSKSLEEAANILDIDQTTLWRWRKKYGI
jgi:two-component system, NtrC family, response regulator AlgB